MSKPIDLTGQKFGRLTIIRRINDDKRGQSYWLCKCNCGEEKVIHGSSLKNGGTKSCGCLRKEQLVERSIKHGHSKRENKSRTYRSWQHMKERCININCKDYKYYGDRGITVCERWMEFTNFLEDMGEAPAGLQLERGNNDLGYYKENCLWTTSRNQACNRRNNHLITFDDKTQTMIEWSEETHIPYDVLKLRINRYGWSIEMALTTPVKSKRK